MPRTPITPVQAQAASKSHAVDAQDAAALVDAIISGTAPIPDGQRDAAMLECAKILEAAGCYIRRQHAKGLLI